MEERDCAIVMDGVPCETPAAVHYALEGVCEDCGGLPMAFTCAAHMDVVDELLPVRDWHPITPACYTDGDWVQDVINGSGHCQTGHGPENTP